MKPAPNWQDQLATLTGSAELLGRSLGLTFAEVLARFADPPPYYGDPVAIGRRIAPPDQSPREALTAVELEAERRADERYEATAARLRAAYKIGPRNGLVELNGAHR